MLIFFGFPFGTSIASPNTPIGSEKLMLAHLLFKMYIPPVIISERFAFIPGINPDHSKTLVSCSVIPISSRTVKAIMLTKPKASPLSPAYAQGTAVPKPSLNLCPSASLSVRVFALTVEIEKRSTSKTVNDLNKHKFISFGKGTPSPVYNPDWALKLGMKDNKKRKTVMKVNSVYGLLLAVQSGVGLAALPDYLTIKQPNIVKVLPKIEGPITEAHFVYPQSLKNEARLKAFRNFIYSKISEWEF